MLVAQIVQFCSFAGVKIVVLILQCIFYKFMILKSGINLPRSVSRDLVRLCKYPKHVRSEINPDILAQSVVDHDETHFRTNANLNCPIVRNTKSYSSFCKE